MHVKPKILYVIDVAGWGGEQRANASKKYLTEHYHVDIILEKDFNEQLDELPPYDLYYLSYHTMLGRGEYVKRLPYKKIITMVTGRHVYKDKDIFKNSKQVVHEGMTVQEYWEILSSSCLSIFVNNLLAFRELKTKFSGPIFYVPRGVDTNVFHPVYPFPQYDQFRTCFVGKCVEQKGIFKFIRPASKATNSKLIENTRIWTNALSPEKMAGHYSKCNVNLVASIIDGTPNPLLESAACERPSIANVIGNVPEFIKDGYNGFIVNLDVDEYIEKINWMKNHPKETEKMGKEARKTVLDGWTWKHSIAYEKNALDTILEIK